MAWNASVQPRKQRKWRASAPLHKRQKLVSVHLSKELRKKLDTKRRSLPVRKGDRVKVLVGSKSGHVGKVARVSLSKLKVYVEGVAAKEARGTEKLVPIDPSNLLLVEAEMGDKLRTGLLKR